MTNPAIETVFLDAGGVLCHPSWTRVADALVRHGARVTSSALAAAEQKATRDIDDAHTIDKTDDRARGWLYFNLVLQHAGVTQNAGTDAALVELREYHRLENLWEHVEPDVAPALAALKDRGLRLVVVSNANGRLKHLFDRVDLTKWFDHVLDSHEWGVEKPNPRLFELALEQSRADARNTVHVGDLYHVDVVGARKAGLREGILFDMAGLYEGVDCPRVTSLASLVEWIDKPSGNQTRKRVP
ncbi:MAG TPA: HAD-IA family hydrolase [Vicinamibacterales bacterium]|nr:HAD-IA family hydrolase [Vicinamibacterales bacterium]